MKNTHRSTFFLFFLLAACGQEKVAVYQIPKENSSRPPAVEAANPNGKITWSAPKGWQEQPPTPMRQGSFTAGGANGAKTDISVSGFPGDAGGDLANVNRWRGQINLPPFDETALQGAAHKIDMNGEPALQVEMDEKSDGSGRKIVAAILHHEGGTWFFKMMGDASAVSAQKETFSGFLNTIRFAPGDASPDQSPQANVPPQSADGQQAEAKLKWKLPPGWQEQPAGGMRVGSFLIVEGGRKADISVVTLNGGAGGVLANINRWRGQLSLPAVTEDGIASIETKIQANGVPGVAVDMASEKPVGDEKIPMRIIGAIIVRGDSTWFVKMTGEEALVEKHKPDFLDFVKSLQIP